jgi:tetratricopeptide (TPR) repeat protein
VLAGARYGPGECHLAQTVAQLRLRGGDTAQAGIALRTLTAACPSARSATTLALRARLAERAGDVAEARRVLTEARAADPGELPALLDLARLDAAAPADVASRRRALRDSAFAVVRRFPGGWSAWRAAWADGDDAARVDSAARRALAAAPDAAAPWIAAALAATARGDLAAARAQADSAARREPASAVAQGAALAHALLGYDAAAAGHRLDALERLGVHASLRAGDVRDGLARAGRGAAQAVDSARVLAWLRRLGREAVVDSVFEAVAYDAGAGRLSTRAAVALARLEDDELRTEQAALRADLGRLSARMVGVEDSLRADLRALQSQQQALTAAQRAETQARVAAVADAMARQRALLRRELAAGNRRLAAHLDEAARRAVRDTPASGPCGRTGSGRPAGTLVRLCDWPSLGIDERLDTVKDLLEYAADAVQAMPGSRLAGPIGIAHLVARALGEVYALRGGRDTRDG